MQATLLEICINSASYTSRKFHETFGNLVKISGIYVIVEISTIWIEYSSAFYENYIDLNMYIPVNPVHEHNEPHTKTKCD